MDRNLLAYDVYFSRARIIESKDYIRNVTATNTSDTIVTEYSLTSTVRITELEALNHVYYLTVQLVVLNQSLSGWTALPRSSPKLELHAFCDLVG